MTNKYVKSTYMINDTLLLIFIYYNLLFDK